ncbi:MAG: hypothetical protein R2881_10445 [Eubacteriales bacterium]
MEQSVSTQAKQSRSALKRSLLITAVYALVGYAWIIGSELVLASVIPESTQIFLISIIKGLGFVTATAALIFILVFSSLRKVIHESDKRRNNEIALEEAQRIAHIGNFSYDDTDLQQFQFFRRSDSNSGSRCFCVAKLRGGYLALVHIEDRQRVFAFCQRNIVEQGTGSV